MGNGLMALLYRRWDHTYLCASISVTNSDYYKPVVGHWLEWEPV